MTTFPVLKSQLTLKFKDAIQENSFPQFLEEAKEILSSLNSADVMQIVDLTITDVVKDLFDEHADSIQLERVLQFSIDAALHDVASGYLPVAVMGEILDCSPIEERGTYFSFLENRVDTFKKELFFKPCKTHLLRICNDLSKQLSTARDTVFRGRISMFLAHIFPLSERSGLNIRSEFNLENTTDYSTADEDFSDLTSEKEEDETEEGEISSTNQSPIVVEKKLYIKFWSLQDYFRSPNTCYTAAQWDIFTENTSEILTVFRSFKSEDANNSKWKQAEISSPSGACLYFAKYLTSPKLLELQLSDSHFRRFILVQFLILFHYLSSPVKFKLENFLLSEKQQIWIKDTVKRVYQLLEETPPNGETFARDVEKILHREDYWNKWKNEGCPDFKSSTDKPDLEKGVNNKRPWDDLRQYPILDTPKIWDATPNNWEACRSVKRNFVPTLESYFGVTGNNGSGQAAKRDTSDANYNWRALRLLCMKSPHIFAASTTTAKSVPEYLDSIIPQIEKENAQSLQEVVVETAVAEDETVEDDKDDFFPAIEDHSKDVKKDILTKGMIEAIAETLKGQWQALAVKLGFQVDEIEYYETSQVDAKMQIIEMLTVWMERDGGLAEFTNTLSKEGLFKTVEALASYKSGHH